VPHPSCSACIGNYVYICHFVLATCSSRTVTYCDAGQTNGKVGCTTYGPSDQLNGFTFKTGGVPIGGIEACGYSGSFITSTGSSGTVIQSNSPPGILLGTNPQFAGTYTGNATARASFGNLGVKTDGSIVGPSVIGGTVLFQATAGAIFTDKLTATSNLVANGTAGTVRYLLGFSGSETVPQRLVSGGFGEAYAEVELTHGTEQVRQVLNISDGPGRLGLISNAVPPAGWTTALGSISGSSIFETPGFAFTWGTGFDIKLGLLSWQNGTSATDFYSSLKVTGFELFNSAGQAINTFNITAESGTNYINGSSTTPNNTVPIPSSAALTLLGLLGLFAFPTATKKLYLKS
jgi:hypothetical protein